MWIAGPFAACGAFDRYGAGPLLLRIPGRSLALVPDAAHVHRVLGQTPEPFAAATREKIGALAHFEPKGVLISRGVDRADRRRFNEEALEPHQPNHRLVGSFVPTVAAEARRLRSAVRLDGALTWASFSDSWFRMVRQVVFGRAARDDYELYQILNRLRSSANWAFLSPERGRLRDELIGKIRGYLLQADSESLAGLIAQIPVTARTAPEQQVPQWFFAFDAAAMATYRALALLASHPENADYARQEIADRAGSFDLPYLRATVLESLRLWPTTPPLLRESTAPTEWESGEMPAGTAIVIFTPFFHRDDERVPFANQFAPQLWLDGIPPQTWPLIPFSAGPAECPGRELVLLLSTAMLSALLVDSQWELKRPAWIESSKPLPGTLSHFGLCFELKGF